MESTDSLHRRLTEKIQTLAFFRVGPRDVMPLQIGNRRIYVLPSRFGLFCRLGPIGDDAWWTELQQQCGVVYGIFA